MTKNIEEKIRKLLLLNQNPQEVSKGVVSFLEVEGLKYEDKRRLFLLLFNMGFYELIGTLFLQSLKKKEPLFWDILCETLFLHPIKVPTLIQKNILKGAYKEKKLSFLALSPNASLWGSVFEKNRNKKFRRFEKMYEKKKKKLQR